MWKCKPLFKGYLYFLCFESGLEIVLKVKEKSLWNVMQNKLEVVRQVHCFQKYFCYFVTKWKPYHFLSHFGFKFTCSLLTPAYLSLLITNLYYEWCSLPISVSLLTSLLGILTTFRYLTLKSCCFVCVTPRTLINYILHPLAFNSS